MSEYIQKIGIIDESRPDENRTPLVPVHIKKLLKKYSSMKIIVQPSSKRCFPDQEYADSGAVIKDDLSECDIIMGVKEILPELLIDSKIYMFFSHTSKIQSDNSAAAQGTPGMDKKELLFEILKKKITLIDYENLRDKTSKRYLGFGRFAGIVGCYNSLNLYLESINEKVMERAYILNSYEKLKSSIRSKDFKDAKIILTGDGRVTKGAIEYLEYTNIKKISEKDFINYNESDPVYCNLPTSSYVKNLNGNSFDLQDFIKNPKNYVSQLENYLPFANLLISAHYWDPKSPKLFDINNLSKFKQLMVIGDITCDINGSIPTTIRASTIKEPNYYIDKKKFKEINKLQNGLAIMAVDNLPSELPKESSTEFGDGIVEEIIPFLINDDGRIKKATITSNGKFCSSYEYLYNYINS